MKKFMLISVTYFVLTGSLFCCRAAQTAQAQEDYARSTTRSHFQFGLGVPLYRHTYEEAGLMKETGWLFAPAFTGFMRTNIDKLTLELEFEIAQGKVNYDGKVQSIEGGTEPLEINGVKDEFKELRLLGGLTFSLPQTTTIALFSGLGWRWWQDDLGVHELGYLRESRYVYIPVGIRIHFSRQSGGHISAVLEYDVFREGVQESESSDVSKRRLLKDKPFPWEYITLEKVTNHQKSGYGLRGSVMWVSQPISSGGLRLRYALLGFIRFWHIADSDIQTAHMTFYERYEHHWTSWTFEVPMMEPENKTIEFGAAIILQFGP